MPEIDTVLFIADLSGYTAFTEAHGAHEAVNLVTRYTEIAQTALEPGVRIVERVGDELLIMAEERRSSIQTACKLHEAIEREPLFPTVRIGLHAGRVVEQNGKLFGAALNLTARVAAYARGGQMLCTERIAGTAQELDDVACHRVGLVRFKNIPEPVAVFEIRNLRAASEESEIDPVCRMQVLPETAPARLPFQDKTYYFCSFACAKAFAEHPDNYIER